MKKGRIDIVIFPNGGWEYIGREESDPPIPLDDLLPFVLDFVGKHQGLETPQKFTAYYGGEQASTFGMRKARSAASSTSGFVEPVFGDYEGLMYYQTEEGQKEEQARQEEAMRKSQEEYSRIQEQQGTEEPDIIDAEVVQSQPENTEPDNQ